MKLVDLALLYTSLGVACAVALYRRSPDRSPKAMLAALTAVPLWPIWAPIAWTARRESPPSSGPTGERVERIRVELDLAVQSVRGSSLEGLFDREAARIILEEAERASHRNQELIALLSREEFDLDAVERRAALLLEKGASPRACASARVHCDNVRRLHAMADKEGRGLDELAALVSALRTELMVVKLSGSSAESVDGIIGDLWANIEGLRQVTGESRTQHGHEAENPA
jgi:hypothetical protein